MQLPSIKKREFPKTMFKPCDLPRRKVSKARQDFATPPKGLHESVYVLWCHKPKSLLLMG